MCIRDRLTPLAKIDHPVDNHDDFSKLVKQAFGQRRNTIRNTLKGLLTSEQIESLDIEPSARAESLSVKNFTELTNLYSRNQS